MTLLILGVLKSKFTMVKWYVSSIESLFLGAIVAGLGYIIANTVSLDDYYFYLWILYKCNNCKK